MQKFKYILKGIFCASMKYLSQLKKYLRGENKSKRNWKCLSAGLGSIHFFQFNSIPIQVGFWILQFNSIPIQIGFRIFQFNSNSIHFLSIPIQFKFYAP